MGTKPQDVAFALKLICLGKRSWTYAEVADELCLSASEANAAAKRAITAGLCRHDNTKHPQPLPIISELRNFLIHGIRYVYPAVPGAVTRGVPTAFAAPPLTGEMRSSEDHSLVWPWPEGNARGQGVAPLYKSAPRAALDDDEFYRLLALVDVLRGRSARGREIAAKRLTAEFENYARSESP